MARSSLPSTIRILIAGLALALPSAAQAPRDAARLRAFFHENCVKCHGEDGSAVGIDGKKLKGLDFTDPKLMAGRDDPELAKTIRKGIFFGLGMPSFKKQLTDAEIQTLITEVLRKAEKGKTIS